MFDGVVGVGTLGLDSSDPSLGLRFGLLFDDGRRGLFGDGEGLGRGIGIFVGMCPVKVKTTVALVYKNSTKIFSSSYQNLSHSIQFCAFASYSADQLAQINSSKLLQTVPVVDSIFERRAYSPSSN